MKDIYFSYTNTPQHTHTRTKYISSILPINLYWLKWPWFVNSTSYLKGNCPLLKSADISFTPLRLKTYQFAFLEWISSSLKHTISDLTSWNKCLFSKHPEGNALLYLNVLALYYPFCIGLHNSNKYIVWQTGKTYVQPKDIPSDLCQIN